MLASLLLVPAAILFLLERRWVGKRLYTTVLGRGVRGERGPTPRGLKVFLVAFCSLVAIFVTLIYAGIVIGGLTRVWGADWHLTLRHWPEAIKRWPPVQTSLMVRAAAPRVFIAVSGPLLRRTAGVAFIATFVNSVTNLSITMFLVPAHYLVATVSVLALVSDNRLGVGAALTTLLLVLTFGALTLGFRWIGPDILME